MSRISVQDVLQILRGLKLVAEAGAREQSQVCKHLWANSSVRELIEENCKASGENAKKTLQNPAEELKRVASLLKETKERGFVVAEGFRQLIVAKAPQELSELKMSQQNPLVKVMQEMSGQAVREDGATSAAGHSGSNSEAVTKTNRIPLNSTDAANLDISSITLKELEEILSKRGKDREVSLRTASTASKLVREEELKKCEEPASPVLSNVSESTLKADTAYVENVMSLVAGVKGPSSAASAAAPIEVPTLSKVAKQRRVPSSRLGRMASFGGLFAGLGIGTINELTKGALGLGGSKNVKEALLSPANAERIVDTLCKVRGAALKIGQILSIQDSNVVSPQLAKAFERVRQAADYMPDWQVQRVLNTQLGPQWSDLLQSFDEKPFAAASIGQVHRATLKKNSMEVAIKIQYPGVAQSIESDIDNLVGMLKVWDVFPQGFFIDNVVKVAKRELTWEVDYTREAEYTEQFKQMIAPYPEYYVPAVVRDLTTASILTTELIPGVPLDKCFEMNDEHRHHIAASVLKLCLRELFELECMQTDPNWSNFLYDAPSRRLMLIDFGSTRFYKKDFIRNYRNIIMCAANNNRQGVLEISREMGFLTGYESKQMEEAHVDAVMILGEIFRYDGEFDFGKQMRWKNGKHRHMGY